MDHYCLCHTKPISLRSLPSSVNHAVEFSSKGFHRPALSTHRGSIPCFRNRVPADSSGGCHRRGLIVAASYNNNKELSSSNTPLVPGTPAGRLLGRVMLDDPDDFQRATFQQLNLLAIDRCKAQYKINTSKGDDERCLNRRIYKLRVPEWQIAAEDIMYMSILHKFRKIGVHLTPKLSSCIVNHRLEISSKDWALESIHSSEVLEIIKEFLTTTLGWNTDSNVKESWATTHIPLYYLRGVYETSILYGYFLKSASLRHHLELCFGDPKITYQDAPLSLPESSLDTSKAECRLMDWVCYFMPDQECCNLGQTCNKLMCYITELDSATVRMCGRPRTKEAASLVQKHTRALFMDRKNMWSVHEHEMIVTSFSSLKRMFLEAVALGTFLWDTEDYVDDIYKLTDNS